MNTKVLRQTLPRRSLLTELRRAMRRQVRTHLPLMQAAAAWRALAQGSARRRVAVFHIGRCGSTVLSSLLSQSPEVSWGGEIFDFPRLKATPGFRPSRGWIRAMIEIVANAGRGEWFGFESRVYDFNDKCIPWTKADFVSFLEDLGFTHFVVLRRRNLLRFVISVRVAQETARLHVAREPAQPTQVHVDPANPLAWWPGSLIEIFEHCERFYGEVAGALAGRSCLDLTYEADIEADPLVAYGKVCAFIGLEQIPVRVRHARTNPFAVRKVVSNYAELEAYLRGTRFEWMLADGALR